MVLIPDIYEIPIVTEREGYLGKLIRIFDTRNNIAHLHLTDKKDIVRQSVEIRNYQDGAVEVINKK